MSEEQVQEQSSTESQPLTQVDQDALKARILELKRLLDQEEERREKYKIEVVFDKRKTTRAAFPGSVIVLRSGSAMSGDGDEIVYPCPNKDTKCPGIIPPENISTLLDIAYCDVCGINHPREELSDFTFYRLEPAKWAYVLAREFYRCGCNASFYMKTAGEDLREHSRSELARPQRGDALRTARKSRGAVMYELYRIIQDISTGADLEKQLKALITA